MCLFIRATKPTTNYQPQSATMTTLVEFAHRTFKVPAKLTEKYHELMDTIYDASDFEKFPLRENEENEMCMSMFFMHALFYEGVKVDLTILATSAGVELKQLQLICIKFILVWTELNCNVIFKIMNCFRLSDIMDIDYLMHMIYIIGRIMEIRTENGLTTSTKDFDDIQLITWTLYYKYWQGDNFRMEDLSRCVRQYKYKPSDIVELEIQYAHVFIEADLDMDLASERKWRSFDLKKFNDDE